MTYRNLTAKNLLIAAVALLLLVATTPSFGQADRVTSQSALATAGFLTTGEISDDLEGNDDEYFYKFKAGPGKLTVTLEVVANETNAGAMLDLFSGAKPILSNMLVQAANRGSEMAFQSVNLSKPQDVTLRIKGMKYGSSARYPGVYKILLDGNAVKFAAEETGGQGGEQEAPIPPGTGGTIPQNNTPNALPTDGTETGSKPTANPTDVTSQSKKPDKVDKVIEKGKSKTKKVLEILNKVKEKIPD